MERSKRFSAIYRYVISYNIATIERLALKLCYAKNSIHDVSSGHPIPIHCRTGFPNQSKHTQRLMPLDTLYFATGNEYEA